MLRLVAVAAAACSGPETGDARRRDGDAFLSSERGAEPGPDDAGIGAVRVTVETGTVNGAGTHNPVYVPATLGELRRTGIVLTLGLGRAEIGVLECRTSGARQIGIARAVDYEPAARSGPVMR